MIKSFIVFLSGMALASSAFGQVLPAQWRIGNDGHTLVAGDMASTGIYDENTLEEIRL